MEGGTHILIPLETQETSGFHELRPGNICKSICLLVHRHPVAPLCFLYPIPYPICFLRHAKSKASNLNAMPLSGNSGSECRLLRQVSALHSNRSFVKSWSPTMADMPHQLRRGQLGGVFNSYLRGTMGTTVLYSSIAWVV